MTGGAGEFSGGHAPRPLRTLAQPYRWLQISYLSLPFFTSDCRSFDALFSVKLSSAQRPDGLSLIYSTGLDFDSSTMLLSLFERSGRSR